MNIVATTFSMHNYIPHRSKVPGFVIQCATVYSKGRTMAEGVDTDLEITEHPGKNYRNN